MLPLILLAKQSAPFRQYHVAYAGGQLDSGNEMFGRNWLLWLGGRGFGVDREEQPSAKR